ncbi:hypothetical protein Tco_1183831 [Tanacetum coccineum]
MYYLRFTKVIIHHFLTKDKTVFKRNNIGMHTSRDDYLINTLRFISAKEESQIYGPLLPKSLTRPEMRETKAYKTYLGYSIGVTPPKKAQKFKNPASPKLSTIPVSPEEPTRIETPVMSLSKKKEKVTVEKRKIIDLLSKVALTEEAQYEEVHQKSLRDFYKTHPSGSGTVTKIAPSAAKIKPSVTNEGAGTKLGVLDVNEEESTEKSDNGDDNAQSDNEKGSDSEHETNENESGSESDQGKNEEDVEDDEEEKDDEFVKTPSNSINDEDENNVEDKAKGDEDKEIDYTTNQFDDDVDVRLNDPVNTDEGLIRKKGTDAEMINVQQGNENSEITLNQVIEDAHVTISTILKKTKVPFTSFSHSSDLTTKFLNFADIPTTDAKIISPMDVHVYHEVPSNQTPTLVIVSVSVITESSPVFTVILQSLPLPQQSTLTPPPTTEATHPPSAFPNFASDDPLNTQVTAQVDEHLDSRLGATKDEFMSYLLTLIIARITKQVKTQLPQILPKEVSNFAPPVIKSMVTESLEHTVLAKESSQPKSTYEAAASLTKFNLKKILIDKMDENKDEDPSVGSDRGLKKRKTSKDDEPTKGPKAKESKSGSSKGTKSQLKSAGKSVHAEEPEFEVADSKMPQDQEENLGDDNEEPKKKTPQQGPTQSWLMTLASSADKSSKTFDELMSTPIDFSAYIMNGLKITNLTQETLLGPAFKLLKGTRTNFAELEYDFEECYKALSEKLDWENPEGSNYPFDLTKPLPLVMNGNRQIVSVDYFFNNDLKYLQGGILTMTYTTSITKTKAAQYDLIGIEYMTFYGYARGLESSHDVYSTKRILAVTRVEVMRKHGYGYLREIKVRRADNDLYIFMEGDFPQLRINDIEDMMLLVVQNRLTNLSGNDVSDFAIAL